MGLYREFGHGLCLGHGKRSVCVSYLGWSCGTGMHVALKVVSQEPNVIGIGQVISFLPQFLTYAHHSHFESKSNTV